MSNNHSSSTNRGFFGYISPWLLNFQGMRNPWMAAWWSACFPGFGYILSGNYFIGIIFIFWEFLINHQSNINEAIFHTMIGNIDQAKNVIDKQWFLLYSGVYVFCIWDSYRRVVSNNKAYKIGYWENRSFETKSVNAFEINLVEKRSPITAALWSLIVPGLGHFYSNNILLMLITSFWVIICTYNSHLLQAAHFTFTGDFAQASQILVPQWFIYLPSLYGFLLVDSYRLALDNNNYFEIQQAKYFKQNYQSASFKMPF